MEIIMYNSKRIAVTLCAAVLAAALIGCSGAKNASDTKASSDAAPVASSSVVALESTEASETTVETEEVIVEVVAAEEDFVIEISDGKAVVVGFSGTDATTVVIPSVFDGCPVVEIGDDAFNGCTAITKLEIPEGVTTIGARAFYNCQGLTTVVLPESLTTIKDLAFSVCMKLSEVTVPASVTTIGHSPFFACAEGLVLKCAEGSEIAKYAVEREIKVEYVD